MNETQWTKQVCIGLERKNAFIIPYVGNRRQKRGVPDRWITHRLWTGWLEFKGARTKIEPLQLNVMQSIWVRRPGTVFILRYPGIILEPFGTEQVETFEDAFDLLGKLKLLRSRAS